MLHLKNGIRIPCTLAGGKLTMCVKDETTACVVEVDEEDARFIWNHLSAVFGFRNNTNLIKKLEEEKKHCNTVFYVNEDYLEGIEYGLDYAISIMKGE